MRASSSTGSARSPPAARPRRPSRCSCCWRRSPRRARCSARSSRRRAAGEVRARRRPGPRRRPAARGPGEPARGPRRLHLRLRPAAARAADHRPALRRPGRHRHRPRPRAAPLRRGRHRRGPVVVAVLLPVDLGRPRAVVRSARCCRWWPTSGSTPTSDAQAAEADALLPTDRLAALGSSSRYPGRRHPSGRTAGRLVPRSGRIDRPPPIGQKEAHRGPRRAEVRRLVRRRRRGHQARRRAHRRRPSRPATTSSSSSPRWATPPTSCSTWPSRSRPLPAGARAGHAAHRRRADLDGAARDGHRATSAHEARSFTGSQAGVITDSAPTASAKIIDVTPGRIAGRARRGRDRDRRRLPGRQPGHQGHHHAGPRRLGHHRRRAGRRARRRRLRDLHRRRRRLHRRPAHRAQRAADSTASPTRRCSRWRPAARRSCTCAASSTPAATACRSTCGRRSRQREGTWVTRSRGDDMEQAIITGVAHDRSEAKITVVGVPDEPGEAAAHLPRRRRRRGQHRHDRAERLGGRDRPHRHLVHAAHGRRPDGDGRAGADPGRRSASSRCSTTTRSARSR